MDQLWRGSLLELKLLARNFTPKANLDTPPNNQTRARWQQRYANGVKCLQQAGIKTTGTGVNSYIALRTEWDRYITTLAPQFAYDLDEIDVAIANSEQQAVS